MGAGKNEVLQELAEIVGSEQQEEADLLITERVIRKPSVECKACEVVGIDEDDGEGKHGKTRWLTGTSNVMALLNTIMGAGILGLPGAFAKTGYLLGCVLLTVFALTSWLGLHLLVCVARHVNPDPKADPATFKGVADAAFPHLSLLVDAVVFIKCFGVATSYLMLTGDSMPRVAPGILGRQGWIMVSALVVVPLAYLKSLTGAQLNAASVLSFICALFIMSCIIAYSTPSLDPCSSIDPVSICRGPTEAVPGNDDSALSVLSVFIFAFTCHQNAFSALHNELPRHPPQRADCVSLTAVGCALIMYLCISLAGYFTFGKNTHPDVLENYPEGDTVITFTRLAASTLVLLGYPMQVHPARKSICSLLGSCGAKEFAESHQAHWLLTTGFLCTSISTALKVQNFGLALALVGATGSTTITFILPGFVYCRLFLKPHPKRWLALAQCTLGCVIVPFALTMIIVGRSSAH